MQRGSAAVALFGALNLGRFVSAIAKTV